MKTLTAPDATAVVRLPPAAAKAKRRRANPPKPRVITGRGWVA